MEASMPKAFMNHWDWNLKLDTTKHHHESWQDSSSSLMTSTPRIFWPLKEIVLICPGGAGPNRCSYLDNSRNLRFGPRIPTFSSSETTMVSLNGLGPLNRIFGFSVLSFTRRSTVFRKLWFSEGSLSMILSITDIDLCFLRGPNKIRRIRIDEEKQFLQKLW